MTEFQKRLIFRHLLFFILKQVVFIAVCIGFFTIAIYMLGEIMHDFLNTHSSKSGIDGCIESIIMFFVGIFIVLIFAFVILFGLAVLASFLASVLINYIVSEMDVTQKEKTTGQKIGHSILPPIGGIAAASFLSGIVYGIFNPGNDSGLQPIILLLLLSAYFGANYYFDRKFYMEGVVEKKNEV